MKIYKHFNANSLMTLFNGDCQKLLKEIPDETIDLIITSPPYCMKKAYEDPHADTETFKRLHEQIFDEIYRVLKPGGSLCWQVGYHVSNSAIIPLDYLIYDIFTAKSQEKDIRFILRVVSFMMSAEDLLKTCYVLRKDNWEESAWLYQRLMDKKKIKGIRDFIEKKGEAFYNNIIVALPDNVSFEDGSSHSVDIDHITSLEPNCKLILPKEMNSICVIDGQHRIFAHYESGTNNKQEQEISELRKQLHLLVTGLVFPKDMTKLERAKIQSEIFLDINSNAKPVQPNVLLHIQKIKDPLSDMSLAQFVIEELNKQQIFKDMFELSSLENGRIKTASIVKFALRYLVTVKPSEERKSLIAFWDGDRTALTNMDDTAFKNYVDFCARCLREYFCAIKKNFKQQWEDPNSKMLSVISLNGFIIAYTRQLSKYGTNNFDFYDEKFAKWEYDFSKENFQYTSSQYRMFSSEILKGAFDFSDEELETT